MLCAPALALLALGLTAAGSARAAGVISIQSGGNGHGIGLSQYGADGYAQHGKDYRFILAHYYQGTELGQTDPAQLVRVLLSSNGQPTFSGADRAGGNALDPAISYTVRPNADGTLKLVWHAVAHGKPVLKQLSPFAAPLSVSGPQPLVFAGKGAYRGSLVFRPAGGVDVQTVDSVGLDDYVRGVVAAEVPASWPTQALKAQAVAARTYAITTSVNGATYDLYPDTRSQMYGGVSAETAATDAAVDATRGQVVTYGGIPVTTYFSASSGGHTESIQNQWPSYPPEPWLVGVPDPYDAAGGQNPYHSVTYVMSLKAAEAKLAGLFRGSLVGIRVLRQGVSPRVITAEVIGTLGSSSVTGAELQRRFGLLTNWEVFTTVTAEPGKAPGGTGQTAAAEAAAAVRAAARQSAAGAQTQAMSALVPLVDTMLVQAIPGLHGTVIPAPAGARLVIQLREHGRWRTVAHPRIGQDGGYDLALPGRGVYRVRYGSLTGPVVTVN